MTAEPHSPPDDQNEEARGSSDRDSWAEKMPRTQRFSSFLPQEAWVLEISGVGAASARLMKKGAILTVGSAKSSDVLLSDPSVSARHCTLEMTPAGIEVADLGSTNGTFVGAAKVKRALLTQSGAIVVVGRTTLRFSCDASEGDESPVEPLGGLVGRSPAMLKLYRELRQFGARRGNVLVQGESGSGKELVARALHLASGRQGRFIAQNAACLPESLADAMLFGSKKGAFTGATSDRDGLFQAAHAGTLFLDEVVDLPLTVQSKLLRVVEEGTATPVGTTTPVRVDVRLVAACWAGLEDAVRAGRFRADLYYRLATTVIQVPPLRERPEDLPELAEALLKRRASDLGSKSLSSGALARLLEYGWPGNVRELDNVLYAAAVRAPGEIIALEHLLLPKVQRVCAPGWLRPAAAPAPSDLRAILEQHSGNLSAAARAAGLPRSTFRARLLRSLGGSKGGEAGATAWLG